MLVLEQNEKEQKFKGNKLHIQEIHLLALDSLQMGQELLELASGSETPRMPFFVLSAHLGSIARNMAHAL